MDFLASVNTLRTSCTVWLIPLLVTSYTAGVIHLTQNLFIPPKTLVYPQPHQNNDVVHCSAEMTAVGNFVYQSRHFCQQFSHHNSKDFKQDQSSGYLYACILNTYIVTSKDKHTLQCKFPFTRIKKNGLKYIF